MLTPWVEESDKPASEVVLTPNVRADSSVSETKVRSENLNSTAPTSKENSTQALSQKAQPKSSLPFKEEFVPNLIFGSEDEDFDLLKQRNYETLLDYDTPEPQSYWQQVRQKEEAEIAKINFESFLQRQEEEGEMGMTHGAGGFYGQQTTEAKRKDSTDFDSEQIAQSAQGERPASISPSKRKRRPGKEYLKNVFSINTSYCRSEIELI